MTDKLDMTSPDLVNQNIEKIAVLFPNCVTESSNGLAIDFDMLKQELSKDIVEGNKERYRLEWPGKREAIVTANLPINKTLRPCREESVDFDNTKNLYIEGDNLEVLKLLQESYLGNIKMIYIDPPYNTGKDFVYKDNFTQDSDEYQEEAGLKDEYNNRLVANPDTSGRYHSDWLTMMYPRLKLARNLLTDDGVIFISIDDNEVHNLRKICDEVFGEGNFVAEISNINNPKGRSDDKYIATSNEFILVYSKNLSQLEWFGFEPTEEIIKRYNKLENNKVFRDIDLRKTGENDLREDRPNLFYYFYYNEKTNDFFPDSKLLSLDDYIIIKPLRNDDKEGNWRWGIETAKEKINKIYPKFMPNRGIWGVMEKDFLEERGLIKPTSSWAYKDVNSERGSESIVKLNFDKKIFSNPKPIGTIIRTLKLSTFYDKNALILDFFSGSATTAHSVMQLNTEDGGNRKFIMVQVPEKTDEKSEAFKSGYDTICEIGKERIRRAGNAIIDNQKALIKQKQEELQKIETKNDLIKDEEKIELLQSEINALQFSVDNLDIGFRVYKLDSSNMQDVYYTPNQYEQGQLDLLSDNIKPDRNSDDLVAQIMLDWGLPLSLKIEQTKIANKEVFKIADDALLCCFEEGIDEAFAKEIATLTPLRIVFRDKSFKDDTAKENVKQLLKQLSPASEMKVI
jgi:adenine-specific DNA-methyltransferase